MAQRSRLLDILQGVLPEGGTPDILDAASPVGTDAIPTSALEQSAPPPPQEPGGLGAIMQAPDMTPDERAELEAELALAARKRLMGGV